MKKILSILVTFVILLSTTCHKQSCDTTYNFDIPFSIIDRDSFRIGDTIWLSSQINNQLMDKISNENIEVSNFDFKVNCGMYRMDTIQFDEAEKYFDFINQYGKFDVTYSSTINTKVIYQKETKSRILKIGMIPKKIGIFQIAFYNLTDDITRIKVTQGECLETLNIFYNMNEGKDFNYYLLKYSLQPLPISTENDYKKDGAYFFKVIK